MLVYNHGQRKWPLRPRSLSWHSEDSDEGHPKSLQDEIDDIYSSLDTLEDNVNSQQYTLAKEIENHVINAYEGVLHNIKGIRSKVKNISDQISETSNLTESSLTEHGDVPRNISKATHYKNMRLSRSPSNLEGRCKEKLLHIPENNAKANHSVSNILHKPPIPVKIKSRGCCFHGDSKIYPYRSYRTKYVCKEEIKRILLDRNSASSSSRSSFQLQSPKDEGCMRGDVIDDWRVKVMPYLWDGWKTPGLDKEEIIKFRQRLEKLQEFKQELWHVQNIHRQRHGCPSLRISDTLSRDAQQWADILALLGYAQYSETPDRGENKLIVDIEYELTGRQVADTWYREGHYFDYNDPKWQKGSANFSQMMWKSSRETGIGITKLRGKNTYVIVAQYYPAGNTNNPGDFKENVPPVKHFESSV